MNRIATLASALMLLTPLSCGREVTTTTPASSQPSTTSSSSSAGTAAPDTAEEPATSATMSENVARETDATSSIESDQQDAVDVIHAYYRAVDAREFEVAYRFWGSHGAPDQTLEQFAAGFADTATTQVKTGKPSGIGAAAGSRYIEVPVTVVATTRDGATQHFAGTYTLRRTVVDGAPAADRAWHIDRASMRAVTAPASK